mmetsp:Transcript_40624/g.85092  ORF Transcript_40624/g.85092 Transcript_40624/m.85092 type:complete len:393 (+) Transcript_40624:15-1193(+)
MKDMSTKCVEDLFLECFDCGSNTFFTVRCEFEWIPSDHFEKRYVTTRQFQYQIPWCFRYDLFLVGIASFSEPQPKKFLVDVFGFHSGRNSFLVRVRQPVSRRVGGVNLVDQENLARLEIAAEFVFGIHQNQSVLVGNLLSKGKHLERGLGTNIKILLGHPFFGDDVFRRDGSVVLFFLCGRGQNVLFQFLVLLHAIGKSMAAIVSHSVAIILPNGGIGRPGHVRTHDKFDWKRLAFLRDRYVWMGNGHDVVLDDVFRLLKPKGTRQIQDGPLVRDECQLPIESGLAIGRHQSNGVVVHVDAVSHLSALGFEADVFSRDLLLVVVQARHGLVVLERLGLQLGIAHQFCLAPFSRGLADLFADNVASQGTPLGNRPRNVLGFLLTGRDLQDGIR